MGIKDKRKTLRSTYKLGKVSLCVYTEKEEGYGGEVETKLNLLDILKITKREVKSPGKKIPQDRQQ